MRPPTPNPPELPSASSGAEEVTQIDGTRAQAEVAHHRQVARNLALSGGHARAFTELLKALRAAPPTAALAREIIRVAERSGLLVAAAAALEEAWASARASERLALHRILARLWRHQGRLDQARLHLYQLLAEAPGDLRAQHGLAHLLSREGRPQELEKVLLRVADEAARRGRFSRAALASLARARILKEPLANPAQAALAFARAAGSSSQAGELEAAVSSRMLALRALVASGAPPAALNEAARQLIVEGRDAGVERQAERAALVMTVTTGIEPARLLIERAVLAEARGARAEAAAFWEAALEANPAATDAAERLERLLTARGAWVELAGFLRRQVERAPTVEVRASALGRLAGVYERSLRDPGAAAQAQGELFALTGASSALLAQLELLERAGGPVGAEAALDRAIAAAAEPSRKATALRLRAERHFGARRYGAAAADWERVSALGGLSEPDALRLGECQAEEGIPGAIQALWKRAEALAPGAAGRGELHRRLARLSAWPLGEPELSRTAWAVVLTELPGDPEAEERLLQLARARNRPEELVPILQARALRLGRGPEARQARHDVARLLERLARPGEALEVWRAAVRLEPGDATAQLALAERLEAAHHWSEAALALEGAAHALDGPRAQGEAWARLARLHRDALRSPEQALACERRARALGVEPSPPPELPVLRPGAKPPPPPELTPKPARQETGRRRRRTLTSPHKLPLAEVADPELIHELERAPLEVRVHRKLARDLEGKGDTLRASLFTEVARALEGYSEAQPLPPRATFTASELASLRHPELKGPIVEALSLLGEALAAQYAIPARRAPSVLFTLDAGKGAPFAGQALFDAVRLLGRRAPDVVIAAEDGPPFALLNTDPVRLAVGKLVVKRELSPAELRFYAGRALYSLGSDLLALRLLETEQLSLGLQHAVDALVPKRLKLDAPSAIKALSKRVVGKPRERFAELVPALAQVRPAWDRLVLAARHSANRAGLVAAGGVAPALGALRSKRAGEDELAELVRFAISDRHVRIRAARR